MTLLRLLALALTLALPSFAGTNSLLSYEFGRLEITNKHGYLGYADGWLRVSAGVVGPSFVGQLNGSNVVGAVAQAAHATNADYVTTASFVSQSTLTNQVYGSNVVGAVANATTAATATTATTASYVSQAALTNQVYGSNVVGAVANATAASSATTATTASYVSQATLTNKLYGSNVVGAVANATAATTATTATTASYVSQAVLTNGIALSNAVDSLPFSKLATGQNTAAAMTVGTGASLRPGGSGVVEANAITTNTVANLGTGSQIGQLRVNATGSSAAFTIGATGWGGSMVYPTGWFLDGAVSAQSFVGDGSGLTDLNAGRISSGLVAPARLGTGTANSGTFLRGDGTWAAAPSVSSLAFDAIVSGTNTLATMAVGSGAILKAVGSGEINATTAATATTASYVSAATLTNKVYGSNVVGAVANATAATTATTATTAASATTLGGLWESGGLGDDTWIEAVGVGAEGRLVFNGASSTFSLGSGLTAPSFSGAGSGLTGVNAVSATAATNSFVVQATGANNPTLALVRSDTSSATIAYGSASSLLVSAKITDTAGFVGPHYGDGSGLTNIAGFGAHATVTSITFTNPADTKRTWLAYTNNEAWLQAEGQLQIRSGNAITLSGNNTALVLNAGRISSTSQLAASAIESTSGVLTNGQVVWIVTNALPPTTFPAGSLCTRYDTGDLYVLKGGTWNVK